MDVDAQLQPLLADGEVDAATEVVLREYGGRVFRMMMGVLHDESVAEDVYQNFSIELWRSLASFRGESRVYTWTYTIARRAVTQHLRRGARREQRLGTRQEEELVARWTRTVTAEWRKTDAQERFRQTLLAFDTDDRALVMLRIGEAMPWNDIAIVLHDGADPLAGADLTRESARLRKRFERIKERLKDELDAK